MKCRFHKRPLSLTRIWAWNTQALTTTVTGPLKLHLHRDDEHLPPDSDVVMSVVEGLMLQVAALRFLPPLRVQDAVFSNVVRRVRLTLLFRCDCVSAPGRRGT